MTNWANQQFDPLTFVQRADLADDHRIRANLCRFTNREAQRRLSRVTLLLDGVHTLLQLPVQGIRAEIPVVRTFHWILANITYRQLSLEIRFLLLVNLREFRWHNLRIDISFIGLKRRAHQR